MNLRLRTEIVAWIAGCVALLAVLFLSETLIFGSELGATSVRAPEYKKKTPTPRPPEIHYFKAEPETINEGEASQLSWDLDGATEAYLYPGGENGVVAPGTMIVAPTTTTTYRLEACNEDNCIDKKVTVKVNRKARIPYFEATPSTINQGQSTVLHWAVSDATEAYLDGEPIPLPSGSKQVSPWATTNYTLVARNNLGQAEMTITVVVRQRPYIRAFGADPPIIDQGQSTILRWSISGATEAYINGEPVPVPEGAKEVRPPDTRVYTLVARNAVGEVRADVTITMNPTPTPVPLRVTVVDRDNAPLAGVNVYRLGTELHGPDAVPLGETDANGHLDLGPEFPITLYAEALEATVPSPKHDWAYKKYSLSDVQTAVSQGERVLKLDKKLIGFNILVSAEWDADAEYIAQLREGFNEASRYLYTATEGQVFFEKVTIYDNSSDWKRADFRVHASNQGLPRLTAQRNVQSGFIEHADGYVYLPRYWGPSPRDGRCCEAESGLWNGEHGFKTIARLFGQYGLHLTGESLRNTFDEKGYCTIDKCLMKEPWFSEYLCENCWRVLEELYGLKIPPRRAKGLAIPAPLSHSPFTSIDTSSAEAVGHGVRSVEIQLTADLRAGPPVLKPRVEMVREAGPPVDQGEIKLTCTPPCPDRSSASILLLGASDEDLVHVYSVDGAWSLSGGVGQIASRGFELLYNQLKAREVEIAPPLIFPGPAVPGLRVIIPVRDQLPSPPGVRIAGQELSIPLEMTFKSDLVLPSQGVSPTTAYEGFLPFPEPRSVQGVVEVRAIGADGEERALFSTFSTQFVEPGVGAAFSSDDGRLTLDIPAVAIDQSAQAVIAVTKPPAPPGGDWITVGDTFDVELPEGASQLSAPATLVLYYPAEMVNYIDLNTLSIHRWDPDKSRWVDLGGTVDKDHRAVSSQVDQLSFFALMAQKTFEIATPTPEWAALPFEEKVMVSEPGAEAAPVGGLPPLILYFSLAIVVVSIGGLLVLVLVYLVRRRRRAGWRP